VNWSCVPFEFHRLSKFAIALQARPRRGALSTGGHSAHKHDTYNSNWMPKQRVARALQLAAAHFLAALLADLVAAANLFLLSGPSRVLDGRYLVTTGVALAGCAPWPPTELSR